jgi:NAD(P)-dependent dehydrogenase (short-subunit alcohol dehydrogenase family)
MSNRTVIVTGGARGIGRASALRQAQQGDHVVIWDLDGGAAGAVADEVRAAGGSAESGGVDIADTVATRTAIDDAARRTGRLDGFVHAAGVMRTIPFEDLDEEEYDRLIRVNLRGAFFAVRSAAMTMQRDQGGAGSEREAGSIVVFSSVAGRKGRPLAAHYAASKAAMISLAQSAAMAFGPGVRVNAVCPGVIATPMTRQIAEERHELTGSSVDEPYPGLEETLALRRIGEPDDVAKVVQFLLADLSSYVTGQAINVDGGLEFH